MEEIAEKPNLQVQVKQIPLEDLAMLTLLHHPKIKSSVAKQVYWWFVKIGRGAAVPYPGGTLTSRLVGTTRSGLHEGMKLLKEANLLEVVQGLTGDIQTVRAVIPETISQEIGILYVEWMTISSPSTAQSAIPRPRKKPKDAVTSAPPPTDPAQSGEDIKADAADHLPAEKKGKRPAKLQDEDMALITSSYETMKAWLLFGIAGARDPKNESLPPASANWRVFRSVDLVENGQPTPEGIGVIHWQAHHFAAYFWLQVAYWRGVRNITQTMPQFQILVGHMTNLTKQLGGNWKVFRYIGVLTQHFDLCCAMISGRLADNFVLGEPMLQQPQIKQVAIQLMEMSDMGIKQFYDDYEQQRAAKYQRQCRR